jgi:hypothetical protein
MKKMVKFLERSTLVSQGKNKNGMKKRRWKKWNKEKDENENTWFITYGIKCSAEAEKKEKIYTRRQPSLVNFYKGTLKISEDLFQAQQSDPRVPKIKKKRGSLYIPREPWWSNPQIKQSSPKWGQKKNALILPAHIAPPLFLQDVTCYICLLFAELLVAFQDFLNWRDRVVFCTTVWHQAARLGSALSCMQYFIAFHPHSLFLSLPFIFSGFVY